MLPMILSAQLSITTATINPTCFGNSNGTIFSTPTGGTAPYTYLWSNGKNTKDINLLAAGTYSVTVTDSKGSTAETSATLTQPTKLDLGFSYVDSGDGIYTATLTATGGTPNYLFTRTGMTGWDSNNVFVIPAGTYRFKAKDANDCQVQILKKIPQ